LPQKAGSFRPEATMMPARLYNNQRWTDEDDKLLRSMCEGGKSLTLITAKLKRPMTAIRARAEDLHINIPGTGIAMRRKHF
jgi:hypothetical protein